jgi:hypothetical protein
MLSACNAVFPYANREKCSDKNSHMNSPEGHI